MLYTEIIATEDSRYVTWILKRDWLNWRCCTNATTASCWSARNGALAVRTASGHRPRFASRASVNCPTSFAMATSVSMWPARANSSSAPMSITTARRATRYKLVLNSYDGYPLTVSDIVFFNLVFRTIEYCFYMVKIVFEVKPCSSKPYLVLKAVASLSALKIHNSMT